MSVIHHCSYWVWYSAKIKRRETSVLWYTTEYENDIRYLTKKKKKKADNQNGEVLWHCHFRYSDRVSYLSSFLQLYRKKCDVQQNVKYTISWCNWRLEDRTLWPTTKEGWLAVGTCSDKRPYWYRSAKSQLFGIRNAFGKKEICMSTYYFLHYFDRHTGIKGIKQGDSFGYHKSCKYIYHIFF